MSTGSDKKQEDTCITEKADLRTYKQLLSGAIRRGIQQARL